MRFRTRIVLLIAVAAGLVIATALSPRIAQDPAYHQFADQRTIVGIPHFFDVISNVPFLFVGLWGIYICLVGSAKAFAQPSERWPYAVLFLGVLLTCFGSGYYHWNPTSQSLVWDRLPMTIGFMGLLSATIVERVSHRNGLRLLIPLLLFGMASVFYWHRTEIAGAGDLRPYVLVQFGSLLLFVLTVILFAPKYTKGKYIGYAVGFYALAKVLELLDIPIYRVLHVVSGHTLKHLAAAAAVGWIAWMLKVRTPAGSLALHRAAPEEVLIARKNQR